MPDIPKITKVITQFQGVAIGTDQYEQGSTQVGLARDLVNLQVTEPNRLAVRRGVKLVTFGSGG
jgi:hypothetical protein